MIDNFTLTAFLNVQRNQRDAFQKVPSSKFFLNEHGKSLHQDLFSDDFRTVTSILKKKKFYDRLLP